MTPNARIAPGFGVVSLTLKNGEKADGTLRSETDTEVVLLTGTPPAERKIAKADIASRTDPISAMPPLGLISSRARSATWSSSSPACARR